MTTTEYLASLLSDISPTTFSEKTTGKAKQCVLDVFGCAAAGRQIDSCKILRDVTEKMFTSGNSRVWFSDELLHFAGASVVNSAAASALDLDDGHREAGGHPGASIIPAVFAVAEEIGASGVELLTAVIIGYELGVKIASSRDFSKLVTLSTGKWCAFGVAGACGWLKELSADKIAQAMSIAGILSPEMSAAGYSRFMGNSVKEGIPWGTLVGITAVELASKGYTGPLDILDHQSFFDSEKIKENFMQGLPAIEGVYFKPYGCCRWIHSALDALQELKEKHGIEPEDIKSIKVYTFSRALSLNNYVEPPNIESAQYSIPFCLGVLTVRGSNALLPMKEGLLLDAEIKSVAQRVQLFEGKEFSKMFPKLVPAKVVVETFDNIFEKTIFTPKGDPKNPMSFEELCRKMRHLTSLALSQKDQRGLIDAVNSIERLKNVKDFAVLS